jgi:hypothetical protein
MNQRIATIPAEALKTLSTEGSFCPAIKVIWTIEPRKVSMKSGMISP